MIENAPSRKMALVIWRLHQRPRPAVESIEVLRAAALGDDPSARLERRVEAAKQPIVIRNPVKGGRAEDGVKSAGKRQVGTIPQDVSGYTDDRGRTPTPSTGLPQHRRGPIEADDSYSRRSRDFLRQTSSAAADVEDPLAR